MISPQTLDDVKNIAMAEDKLFLWAILETETSDLPVSSFRTNQVNTFMDPSYIAVQESKFLNNLWTREHRILIWWQRSTYTWYLEKPVKRIVPHIILHYPFCHSPVHLRRKWCINVPRGTTQTIHGHINGDVVRNMPLVMKRLVHTNDSTSTSMFHLKQW